ncbi:MAG: hypothetical protein RJB66_1156 [Pseudomonadota bacterium]|jgi:TolA-binding protein
MYLNLILLAVLTLPGCLQTRASLKESESATAMREQVTTIQRDYANNQTRLEELQDQNRALTGKIEELEFRIKKTEQDEGAGKEAQQKSIDEMKRQNDLLQESLLKMENQMQALQEEIIASRSKESGKSNHGGVAKSSEKSTEASKTKDKSKDSKEKDKSVYDAALTSFEGKKWKEAILSFEQYREKNPKGKHAAEAAYKTGVCFQELGMVEEAKVFYQDVLAKFPQSDMAKKAQARLKTLK